jgi:hypothetical protein
MGCAPKVEILGGLRVRPRAFQELKNAAENQQKTGPAKPSSSLMRLSEGFRALSLNGQGLLTVGDGCQY